MQLIKIAGVALALLMITGTAAAMPGAAPAQADENSDANATETTENQSQSDADAEVSDRRGPPADDADRGPPVDLPSQVPDFVGDLHDTIGQFLDGDRDGSLGERLSELTPDGEDGDSDNETTATPTAQTGA